MSSVQSFDPERVRQQLRRLPKHDLVAVAKMAAALERQLNLSGPQDDDQLHAWIKAELHIDIPRVSVCEGHQSPFQFLADIYFRRTQSAIAVANRGGSKTFIVALLWYIIGKFRRRVTGLTVGAVENQSKRCYKHLLTLLRENKDEKLLASSKEDETIWKNGTTVEIVPGTINQVNGPHPNIVHADEVELMDEEVFYESRNMASSSTIDGTVVPAQNIITSTRKRGHGLMQRLLDEIADAKRDNAKPPYDLYTWCIFECAENQPDCACIYPERAPEQQCKCAEVVKGRWTTDEANPLSGQKRTLKDVCRGRMHRSCGWIPWNDVAQLFTQNSQEVWEAQQECIKPSTEGLVIPMWSRDRYCIRDFHPDAGNGAIYAGIDFGGTNPHAVLWVQVIDNEIEVQSYGGRTRRLIEGTRIIFDEFYKADIPNTQGTDSLAANIVRHERYWGSFFRGWRVRNRFADPQGRAARSDLAAYDPPIKTHWYALTKNNKTERDVKEQVKLLRGLFGDDMIMVASDRCPMFMDEIESWHYPKKKPGMTDDPEIPVDDFDHTMSCLRYVMANVDRLHKRRHANRRTMPSTGNASHLSAGPGYAAPPGSGPRQETWRNRFTRMTPGGR